MISHRSNSTWDSLLLDVGAVPERLDDARYKAWVSRQRIFVSSTMDAEMTPYRDAVRTYLDSFGPGVALMWETISPRDTGPVRAYLDGVDRSTLLVLMLGSNYGKSDNTGYSPTHQEANRAASHGVSPLLFTLSVSANERSGKLNEWLGSLHAVTSGHQAGSPAALVAQLDVRLRELAAEAERPLLKLGRCIFPGKVKRSSDRQQSTFVVTARTRHPDLLHGLRSLPHSGGELRLTWGTDSFAVQVTDVREQCEYVGEADLEISCRASRDGNGYYANVQTQDKGPGELALDWAKASFFGEGTGNLRQHALGAFIAPDCTGLPDVLVATQALGWHAEGVVRLYALEELARQRGGRFVELHVGPATARGVRLNGVFELEGSAQIPERIRVSGTVPISTAVRS